MTRLLSTVALACALAPLSIAGARDGGAHTQISLAGLQSRLARGAVTSAKRSCLVNRKVSLFVYDGFISDKVAITYSDHRGKWRLELALRPGRYFAKVDSVKGCRYAVSPNVWLRA